MTFHTEPGSDPLLKNEKEGNGGDMPASQEEPKERSYTVHWNYGLVLYDINEVIRRRREMMRAWFPNRNPPK